MTDKLPYAEWKAQTRGDVVPGRDGDWMMTNSGERFFPQDPDPSEVSAGDIANALANICRYGGHMDPRHWYSVAEHSALMYDYGMRVGKPHAAVAALFHDAPEAYTNDLVRAVKRGMVPYYPWRRLEERIERAVFFRLGVSDLMRAHHETVKEWDERMIPTERAALFDGRGGHLVWAHDNLEPLPVVIQCMTPLRAKEFFVHCYREACFLVLGRQPEEIKI